MNDSDEMKKGQKYFARKSKQDKKLRLENEVGN